MTQALGPLFRLTTGMLAVTHGSSAGAFFTSPVVVLAITLGGVLVGIATFGLQYYTSVFRQRIIIGMPVSARLIDPSVARANLHVRYGNDDLADPHVSEVVLIYRGRRDIRAASFEEGQPFCIDLGVRIIDLLEKIFEQEAPTPKVELQGTKLKIGPSLLRKRKGMTLIVLTDGPCTRLAPANPFADVKVRLGTKYSARRDERELRNRQRLIHTRQIAGWAVVVFLAWYLFTQPAAAGDAIQHLLGLLQPAGSAIATFLNWL